MNLWGVIKGLLAQDATDRSKEISLEIDPTATTGTRTTLKSAQTANRTIVLPDASTTLVGDNTSNVLTGKTIDADLNTITNIENADIKAAAAIDASKLADGSVSNAEFQRLDGVTSNIQTQISANATSISNHISNPTAAHAGSAISNTPSGNLPSTNVQAALNYLQTEIDTLAPGGGANTSLSNLGSTAVNQNINPNAANTLYLGNSSSSQWVGANVLRVGSTFGSEAMYSGLLTGLGFGPTGMGLVSISAPTNPFNVASGDDSAVNATATQGLLLKTGNKTAGTGASGGISLLSGTSSGGGTGDISAASGNASGGNSGNVLLQTGTASGTRGKIKLIDGTQGTVGHVWTESATDGTGGWAALPATPTLVGTSMLVGARAVTVSSLQYQMSAEIVALRNASNAIVIQANTGNISNNPSTAGPTANGRDQAGAFSNSSWMHFYFIWNGTTLATLSSASAPPTAPTLPSGYTHWAYFGSVYKDSSGNTSTVYQRGSNIYYGIDLTVATLSSNGSIIGTSLSAIIPPNALSFGIQGVANITSTAGGLADVSYFIYSVSPGSIMMKYNSSLTGLGASQTQTLWTDHFIVPNISGTLTHAMNSASGTSPQVAVTCEWYKIPNGGE